MEPIFIIIWILTSIAICIYGARVAIRIQTKKLGLDDLFLGIGAILLLVTFSVGTYVVELADDVKRAMASGNVMGVSDRVDTILKCWYTASATYNFSVWFIKMGIAWFLCRLSNNILQYGRWKNFLFWYTVFSIICVEIVFWATCPPNDFIRELKSSIPPKFEHCRWTAYVIGPAAFNLAADIVLFLYPFPIIFMANIPTSLRYSLFFIFALGGVVAASAVVRMIMMATGNFLHFRSKTGIYAISYWGAVEGSVALLVASLPVIGGRMISRWRHVLTRGTSQRSLRLNRTLRTNHSINTLQSSNPTAGFGPKLSGGAFAGRNKTVETVITVGSSAGTDSPTASIEEPAGLIKHMAKVGRRGSNFEKGNEKNEIDPNAVTIKKEVYITEELHAQPPV